jgi:hypothetical protein
MQQPCGPCLGVDGPSDVHEADDELAAVADVFCNGARCQRPILTQAIRASDTFPKNQRVLYLLRGNATPLDIPAGGVAAVGVA